MFENDAYVLGRIAKANTLREMGINPYGNGISKEWIPTTHMAVCNYL